MLVIDGYKAHGIPNLPMCNLNLHQRNKRKTAVAFVSMKYVCIHLYTVAYANWCSTINDVMLNGVKVIIFKCQSC